MRFAFLCRGNRRRTKVEPAPAKSLKKAVHRSAVIPDSRPYHGSGLLPPLIVTELRLTIEANAMRQLVPPDAFNAVRRQRRVTRRVLEIAVPEVRLQRPRVDAVLSSLTLQTCRAYVVSLDWPQSSRRPNGTVFPAKSNTSHLSQTAACQS